MNYKMKKLFISNSLILALAGIVLGCGQSVKNRGEKTSRVDILPYFNEATYTPQWISEESLPADFHAIPPFSLLNQSGEAITEIDLDERVTVVNFFFTICPGICPKMMGNMNLVQQEFMDDDEVMILSHSVTPKYDSVPVLRSYAEDKGITKDEWFLLTGERDVIYDLGRNQYFVEEDLGLQKDPEEFIHTENFVLIDQKRRIRGIYNGLNKSSVRQLIADIKTLKNS